MSRVIVKFSSLGDDAFQELSDYRTAMRNTRYAIPIAVSVPVCQSGRVAAKSLTRHRPFDQSDSDKPSGRLLSSRRSEGGEVLVLQPTCRVRSQRSLTALWHDSRSADLRPLSPWRHVDSSTTLVLSLKVPPAVRRYTGQSTRTQSIRTGLKMCLMGCSHDGTVRRTVRGCVLCPTMCLECVRRFPVMQNRERQNLDRQNRFVLRESRPIVDTRLQCVQNV